MATTDFISYSLIDHKGDVGQVLIFVPTGGTVAQLQALSNFIVAELDDVTGCQVQSATVNLGLTLPGTLKGAPISNLDKEVGANYAFDAANTPYRSTIRIPAVPSGQRVGELIDDTDTDVQAFYNAIVNGDGTLSPSDRYANDLSAFIQGVVTFRKG
jgi:hypothetical protein